MGLDGRGTHRKENLTPSSKGAEGTPRKTTLQREQKVSFPMSATQAQNIPWGEPAVYTATPRYAHTAVWAFGHIPCIRVKAGAPALAHPNLPCRTLRTYTVKPKKKEATIPPQTSIPIPRRARHHWTKNQNRRHRVVASRHAPNE